MLRTVVLIGAGLAAGLAAAYWLAGSSSPAAEPTARLLESTPPAPSELPSRIVELERQLGAEIEKRTALEQRVSEAPEARDAQRKLAEECTRLVHGDSALAAAVQASLSGSPVASPGPSPEGEEAVEASEAGPS